MQSGKRERKCGFACGVLPWLWWSQNKQSGAVLLLDLQAKNISLCYQEQWCHLNYMYNQLNLHTWHYILFCSLTSTHRLICIYRLICILLPVWCKHLEKSGNIVRTGKWPPEIGFWSFWLCRILLTLRSFSWVSVH